MKLLSLLILVTGAIAISTGDAGAVPPTQCGPEDGCVSACSDYYDNDGDGKIDLADPGCYGPQDNNETDAPPPDPALVPGSGNTWDDGGTYFGTTRCKTQQFYQNFTQAGLFDVIKYQGGFRVCYVPGVKIVSVDNVYGDANSTCCGWEWMGNDQGYPQKLVYTTKLRINWKGSAHFCIYFLVTCGPQKHVWNTILFYPDNTMVRTWGVS